MNIEIQFGSRALNLPPETRKAMADALKFTRMQRFTPVRIEFQRQRIEFWQQQAKATLHDFLTGKWVPVSVAMKPAPVSDRIERTEQERYEDRVRDVREKNARSLSQYDAALRRGPQ